MSRDPRAVAWVQDLQVACQASGCRKWAVVELIARARGNRSVTVSRGKFCRACGRRQLQKALRDAKEFE